MHRGQGTTSDRKRKLGHDESTGESKDASSFDPENVLIKLLCPEIAVNIINIANCLSINNCIDLYYRLDFSSGRKGLL
jgi:hypothetical protein